MNPAVSYADSPQSSSAATPDVPPRRPSWQRRYARLLAIVDAAVVASAVFGSQVFWLGPHPVDVGSSPLSYTTLSLALFCAWLLALTIAGTRQQRVVGYGVAEYRLVLGASFQLFGLFAIAAYLTGADVSRGYFLLSLPLGTVALLGGRALCRQGLRTRRRSGDMNNRVLLVGGADENERVASELARQPAAGLQVVGEHALERTPGRAPWDEERGRILHDRLSACGADSVLISGGTLLGAQDIRRIGWSLDPGRQHLIVAVNLTDVAGPRLHTRPVAGLPLVHIETPQFSAIQRLMKRAFDLVVASVLVITLSPVLAVLALLVRASGPGPILYRQDRVGQGGVPFGMLKFRSMVDGADARLHELLAAQGRGGTPLFKLDDDPRITRVGRWLRKYSLDELPQLFNVLGGQMSLVGPRPQRHAEVEFYDDDAHRRLMVRPGMSGLWQVSGRSALAWDDAIRLDLFYVENWSLVGDIVILMRTFKAVIAPGDTAH